MEARYTAAGEATPSYARDNYRGEGSSPSSQLSKGGQAGQKSRMREIGGGQNWHYGLFDCFTNPTWCLIGFFNPGALIYAIMDKTENPTQGKKVLMWMAFCTPVLLVCFFFFAFINKAPGLIMWIILTCISLVFVGIYFYQMGQLRKHTRERYGIEGDDYMDYRYAACGPLSILQMFYEVHAREGVDIV